MSVPYIVLRILLTDLINPRPLADGTPPPFADFQTDEPDHLNPNSDRNDLPYSERQPLIDVPDPPEDSEYNRLAPPPSQIFPYSPLPPPYAYVYFPPLPRRILPDANTPAGNNTNTARQITVGIGDTLVNHKFGCLLSRPYCNKSIPLQDPPVRNDFWNWLMNKAFDLLDEAIETFIQDRFVPFCKMAVTVYKLPRMIKPFLLVGCEALGELSLYYWRRVLPLDSYPRNGLIYLDGIQPEPQGDAENNRDYPDPRVEAGEDGECYIPLSLIDTLRGVKGYQLQIFYDNRDKTNRVIKQISIPFCQDIRGMTSADLQAILPPTITTGKQMINAYVGKVSGGNLVQKAMIRVFSEAENQAEMDAYIEGTLRPLIRNLCLSNIDIVDYRLVTKQMDKLLHFGTYPLARATLIHLNETMNRWELIERWRFPA